MSSQKPKAMNDSGDTLPSECSYAQENMEGFVLVALDPSDQSRIANHLRWCSDCVPVHHSMKQVADLLPFSSHASVLPSSGIRAALLERVRDHRVRVAAEQSLPPSATGKPNSVTYSSRNVSNVVEPAPPIGSPVADKPRGGWSRWTPTAFIAPLLIALILVSAWGIGQRNQLGEMQQAANGSAANSSSNGTTMRLFTTKPACPTCTGSGQLGADPANKTAFLLVWDLNPAEQHEVWCVHPDGESNLVAVLNVNESGQVMQNLEFTQPLSGYREIRIVRHEDASPELIIAVESTPESVVMGPSTSLYPS